jgi:hypothetical protein
VEWWADLKSTIPNNQIDLKVVQRLFPWKHLPGKRQRGYGIKRVCPVKAKIA